MKTLNPQVAAKYQLIGVRPGKYNFKGFGEIDLCLLTVARADELVKRGFTHLVLRQGSAEDFPAMPLNLRAKPIKQAGGVPEASKEEGPGTEALRTNKQYVNKLLTLDWEDLSYQDRLIFFNDMGYFLEKKKILVDIASIDREMKSFHAKAKAISKNAGKKAELQGIMESIVSLEENKMSCWLKIDTWSDPLSPASQKIADEAAKKAIERDKLIKAHGNFIYRAELVLPNMPEKTASEKKRKAEKQAEVDRRKKELIDIGAPYERKSRK